jgi:4-azaleucine resistance transporter AzlC
MLQSALKNTLPIITAYLALGSGFGLLFATQLPYAWYWAAAMGLFVFAGAAQFLSVGLMAAGAGPIEIALATLVLNLRHFFYGLSMIPRFKGAGVLKPYLIFALTDETYGVLTSTTPPAGPKHRYYALVAGMNQAAWTIGCAIGAFLGSRLSVDTRGIEFMLTALFAVLALDGMRQVATPLPLLLAGCTWGVCVVFFGAAHALLPAVIVLTAGLFLMRRRLP